MTMSSSKSISNLAVAALLLLATCNGEQLASQDDAVEPLLKGLGVVPPTEVATWRKSVSVTAPKGRFLQAVAFDETRQVVVVFGGQYRNPGGGLSEAMQDMWEWSPTTATWVMRTTSGSAPDARGGAAMVFDPVRNKMLLFGGRSTSGYNFEDLWEWDPTTGAWTERSAGGTHPAARAQHGMLFQKSTGKILLFGGGRSDASNNDGTRMSMSFGDTWELDPATATWTALSPTSSPSVRHDFGLVWDSTRNRAVFFGGMQVDIAGATGVPKQDTWEWDPAAKTWTELTLAGTKPSQRCGHATAFDPGSGKTFVFGGWDMQSTNNRNDLWSWDPSTAAWTQLLAGTEAGIPSARSWASMIFDGAKSRFELVAGQVNYSDSVKGAYGLIGANDVWELDPATASFVNRSVGYQGPSARAYHAMAADPTTGKVYVFGGVDPMFKGDMLSDLWEWNGSKWSKVGTDSGLGGRLDAGLAYDPARQSLILFGGTSWSSGQASNDTWEWNLRTQKWSPIKTNGFPGARWGHAMVTDSVRKKILMVGGSAGPAGEVWEWDGVASSWTDRTPRGASVVPTTRGYPVATFDEHRQKLLLYDGSRALSVPGESTSAFWEWDTVTGGWSLRDPGDDLSDASNVYAAYDPIRRRHVFATDVTSGGAYQVWELDAKSATWYVRTLADSPGNRFRSAMVFESVRRVAVLFGGTMSSGSTGDDTWEYSVASLGNGEGCTAASAASCASGHCVDGVCCETAGCTGACKSCNVPGSEGTCVLVRAGTEVPGSCSEGQSCDGAGACKSKNGQACTAASGCASGNCVDGVCCDVACAGACVSCNLPGRAGTCTAHSAGTDPDSECTQGTGACKATCDGVGACALPAGRMSCGACLVCDGAGTCSQPDPACSTGGTGGSVPGKGGTSGGKGGTSGNGGSSGQGGVVGSGGITSSSGGSGGASTATSSSGGSGGATTRSGGSTGQGGVTSGGGAISSGGIVATGGTSASGATTGTADGGGSLGGSGGSSRDAGSTAANGGSGGSSVAKSDAGSVGLDGGVQPADGGLVASLKRGDCSCDLGRGKVSTSTASPWAFLLAAGVLTYRLRRKRPRK